LLENNVNDAANPSYQSIPPMAINKMLFYL